ncbi:MAG: tetratricopeptide repeat protein [Deltaproteobacteria bacterium]|nr:tetratricopeptide repeat protein [Deltaproteobacteria bacterium]
MDVEGFFQGLSAIFASGEQEAISGYLHRSLAEAEAEDDKPAVVAILNEMTGYFRSVSNYAEALKTAERAIALMQTMGYENSAAFGVTLLNAGTAYRAAGDNVRALEMFFRALTLFGDHLSADDHRLAGLFNNIGAVYEETGRYEEALDVLQRAVDILEKHKDMESDAAVVQSNLALILLRVQRDAEARTALEKALTLFRRQAADKSAQRLPPHYAAALAGMGEVHMRGKEYAKAEQAYESALEHIKAAFGENRDYAVTCLNHALACEAAGNSEKAKGLRNKADEVLAAIGLPPET